MQYRQREPSRKVVDDILFIDNLPIHAQSQSDRLTDMIAGGNLNPFFANDSQEEIVLVKLYGQEFAQEVIKQIWENIQENKAFFDEKFLPFEVLHRTIPGEDIGCISAQEEIVLRKTGSRQAA